jgi:hypothetical protein
MDTITLKLLFVALLLAGFTSCSEGGATQPVVVGYDREVLAGITWGDPTLEPTSIYVRPTITADQKKDDASHAYTLLIKLELDFGDGGGWTDETTWYEGNHSSSIKHVYSASGTYEFNARATYWDGEIVYYGYAGQVPHTLAITVPST